jgi:uncharacterized protein
MIKISRKLIKTTALAVALAASLSSVDAHAERKLMTFGTAGVTGVYYPIGGTICRLVNRKAKEHGIRCTVESTGGSIYNLNAIRSDELDVAFAQSDWHYSSAAGESVFSDVGADKNLRSVFSLHAEALTLVARTDADVASFDDLKGKRFNIGNPGSGTRSTVEELLKAKGWGKEVFAIASEFKASEQEEKLCDNKIDAFAFNTGHPNGSIQDVTSTCDVKIIPVNDDVVKSLVSKHSYYSDATIPGGMYTNNPTDIPTYGVKATVVSSANVDDEIIYQMVKAIFENFDNFKTTHPILSNLNKEAMISDGLTAPLHEGAKRYYIEAGLLEAK